MSGASIDAVRAFLYVPGDRPERFDKALASGAGAVILDLEDAVAVPAKDGARDAVAEFLRRNRQTEVQVWVRIDSGAGLDADLAAVTGGPPPDGLVVAKSTADALAAVAARVPDLPLVALVESAAGLLDLDAITAVDGVVALALGEVDLAADLGLASDLEEAALTSLRLQLVVASAARGLAPPIGPVFTAVTDDERLAASTATLARLGYRSRQAIHPRQVPAIDDAFRPSPAEVAAACRVLELAAAAPHGAAVDDDGRLIDIAVVRAARRCLLRAGMTDDEGRTSE